MFDVCTTGDTAHIDTIFKLLPHTLTHYTHHILKHILPQHRKTYNDVFLLINSTKV